MNEASHALRPLTQPDVDAVARLARVVWQATYLPLISQAQIDHMLADRYAPDRIRTQLADTGHAWWVAEEGGVIVAFTHAYLEPPGCKLDKLYVHPDHQRRGIGAALLREVETWARARQAERLWLQVNRGNAQAIHAYEKYGFRVVASRVFDIGDGFVMDDHVMELAL